MGNYSESADKNLKYAKHLVPKNRSNLTFYSFGGRSSINIARENEVVTPALLSNSKHLNTNDRHAVREFSVPHV